MPTGFYEGTPMSGTVGSVGAGGMNQWGHQLMRPWYQGHGVGVGGSWSPGEL